MKIKSISKKLYLMISILLTTMLFSCVHKSPEEFSPPAPLRVVFTNCIPGTGLGIARINKDRTEYEILEEYRTYSGQSRVFNLPTGYYVVTYFDFRSRAIRAYYHLFVGEDPDEISFTAGCENAAGFEVKRGI